MIINDFSCESPRSAMESLAAWYCISRNEFKMKLKLNYYQQYLESEKNHIVSFADYLYKQFPQNQTARNKGLSMWHIHWFHGTRSFNDDDYKQGLLPLSQIQHMLEQRIDTWAAQANIPKSDKLQNEAGYRYFCCNSDIIKENDGPFAMLVKDALCCPSTFDSHAYTDKPEYMEDYAQQCGYESERLLQIIRSKTRPTIIEFWVPLIEIEEEEMVGIEKAALRYAYAMLHPEDNDSMNGECNTCYSAHGNAIQRYRIIRVTH